MQRFDEALTEGFKLGNDANFSYKFGGGYELCFERLLFDDQWYVALYKDGQLLTNKVVVKPGK